MGKRKRVGVAPTLAVDDATQPETAAPQSQFGTQSLSIESLLVAEAARHITARDCAAYAVLQYCHGEADSEEWQRAGVEAIQKFSTLGFAVFHAFGGLCVDWSKIAFSTHEVPKPESTIDAVAPRRV